MLKGKSIEYANCRDPFIELNKALGVGTFAAPSQNSKSPIALCNGPFGQAITPLDVTPRVNEH